MGKLIRTLGAMGGGTLGGFVGHAEEGKGYGRSLGAAISKWLGAGDYEVRVNSLVKGSPAIPMMHQTGQSIVVRHKELLGDVIGGATGATFNVGSKYYLNPGLASSFPWLSSIAQQYQEYSWKGIVFHFVSTSGQSVASTNTSLGSIMLHTDYRVTAPTPTNKQELLNEYFASDAKPSESFCHPIECDPKENPYNVQYVRSGAVPSGEDPKTYDLGVVNVATQGLPSDTLNVGELWVSYEVELKKPQLTGGVTLGAHWSNSAGDGTVAKLLGDSPTIKYNTIGATFNGTDTWTLPAGLTGTFMVVANFYGTGSADSPSIVVTNMGNTAWAGTGSYIAYNADSQEGPTGVSVGVYTISSMNSVSTVRIYTVESATWAGKADFQIMRLPNGFA
jgi:hypothetical protein